MFVNPYSPTAPGGIAAVLGSSGAALFYEDEQAIRAADIPGDRCDSRPEHDRRHRLAHPGAGHLPRRQLLDDPRRRRAVVPDTCATSTSTNGRFLSQDDLEKKALVVVLGAQVADDLFGDTDPVGSTIRIFAGVSRQFGVTFNFTVIGVMERKGVTPTGNPDNQIFVPLPTFQARVPLIRNSRGLTNVTQISIKLTDGSKEQAVKSAARRLAAQAAQHRQ